MGITPIDLDQLMNISPFEAKITVALHELMNDGYRPDKILLSKHTREIITQIVEANNDEEILAELTEGKVEVGKIEVVGNLIIESRHLSLPQIPILTEKKYYLTDLELENAPIPDGVAIVVDSTKAGINAMRIVIL